MRTMQSDLDSQSSQRIKSWARNMQLIRSVWSSPTIQLARGCKRWHLPAPGKRYGTRSPLSEYISLHLSLKQTINCGPFSRIKWVIYFYKEVFRLFIEFHKSCMRVYNTWRKLLKYTFFCCKTVHLLYRFREDYMVHILHKNLFFTLDADSVCSNVVPQLNKKRFWSNTLLMSHSLE